MLLDDSYRYLVTLCALSQAGQELEAFPRVPRERMRLRHRVKDVEPGPAHTSNAERAVERVPTRLREIDRAQDFLDCCHIEISSVTLGGALASRCSSAEPASRRASMAGRRWPGRNRRESGRYRPPGRRRSGSDRLAGLSHLVPEYQANGSRASPFKGVMALRCSLATPTQYEGRIETHRAWQRHRRRRSRYRQHGCTVNMSWLRWDSRKRSRRVAVGGRAVSHFLYVPAVPMCCPE